MSYFSVQKKFANGCDHFFVINFFLFIIKKLGWNSERLSCKLYFKFESGDKRI